MEDILIIDDVNGIQTVAKTVAGKKLKIASIPDLIRLKKKSARPQDLEDIKALEKL